MILTRTLGIGLLVLVCWARPAQAQLAVIDAANLAQNIITAIQTVLMVANQVLELTQGEIVLDGSYSTELETLGQIVEEAQGLAYDVGTLQAQVQALFGLADAPVSAGGLADRLGEIRRVVHDSYVYALRTQTLLRTALSSIRHLMALMDLIGGFVGNMSANQNLAQFDSTLSKTLTTLQVQTVAMQRAEAVEKLATPLILESLDRMQEQLMLDYPR